MAAMTPESRFLEAVKDNDLDGARRGVAAGFAWAAKTPAMREGDWFSSSMIAESERTALMLACSRGHVECVKLLLPASDPLATDAHGQTALHIAAKHGQLGAVALLATIEAARARDSHGVTALMRAAQSGCFESVEALLAVSDPFDVDEDGRDALMWASKKRMAPEIGVSPAVRLLAQRSNLRGRDGEGMSAANLARAFGNQEAAYLLEGFEAEAERQRLEADQSIASGALAGRAAHL